MVVMINTIRTGAGPQGEFKRPGGARFEPGEGTHTIIPNRNAVVTVEVGPPMIPLPPVHARTQANYLAGSGTPGGEVVLGTNVVVPSRTNDQWLRGQTIPSYDGPLQMFNNAEFGRGVVDDAPGPIPRWYPSYPQDPAVEDRSM